MRIRCIECGRERGNDSARPAELTADAIATRETVRPAEKMTVAFADTAFYIALLSSPDPPSPYSCGSRRGMIQHESCFIMPMCG